MAVLESNQTVSANTHGFEKQIHKSAKTMMLDNLQGGIYQKPIASCVRESTSNAVDSVKEKNIAKKILKGEAKVSDYYLTREDVKDKIASEELDIYEDSEFDPAYYDLKWLDPNDRILLTYISKGQTERDQFIISDPGVGLGGHRLEGFFNLGYSSKRLNANELGGFGLGAKSPLATGVESYRMITRYNGKEFCFDIYGHKIDCVYSKWNEDGSSNNYYEFETYTMPNGDPIRAFYKKTNAKNGVSISIDVRKHNRAQFFDAVKSQLMYLKSDIKFTEQTYTGQEVDIPFKTTIIYEDDNIILPESGYFTRPHFVIKDIAYGMIDFNEMDLSPKFGNIGIKVDMEKVDVLQSRENVRYTNRTRAAVLDKYEYVSATVESKIQEALTQGDLLEWIKACNKVMYSTSGSTDVVSRLSNLIDKTALKPQFAGTKIKFNSDIKSFVTPLLSIQHIQVEKTYNYKTGKTDKKTKRVDSDSVMSFDKPLYFQFTPSVNRVTTYLAGLHESAGGYCVVRSNNNYSYLEPTINDFATGKITEAEFVTLCGKVISENETDPKRIKSVTGYIGEVSSLISLLKKGVGHSKVQIYSDALVPDGYNPKGEDDIPDSEDFEAAEEAARKERYKEVLKRRREDKAFVASVLSNKKKTAYNYTAGFSKREVKLSDIDFNECKVVYGTDEDDAVFNMLVDIERTSTGMRLNVEKDFYWDDKVKLMKVSKTNLKFVKDIATPVSNFVINVDDDCTLTSSDKIKSIFTADAVEKLMGTKCDFMRNFMEFSPEICATYSDIHKYVQENSNLKVVEKYNAHSAVKTLLQAHEVNLELINHSSITEEDRQDIIDAKIDNDLDLDIMNIDLIDRKLYDDAVKLVAFADVYSSIFTYIDVLHDDNQPILKPDLVMEIKAIIDARKDQLEFQYENINK